MRFHNLAVTTVLGTLMFTPAVPPQHLSADGAIPTFTFRPYPSRNLRVRPLPGREKLMPEVLVQARKNHTHPPKISTEIALEQIDGNISFFQNDVPSAFLSGPDAATDAEAKDAFAKSNAAVIDALKSYAA